MRKRLLRTSNNRNREGALNASQVMLNGAPGASPNQQNNPDFTINRHTYMTILERLDRL